MLCQQSVLLLFAWSVFNWNMFSPYWMYVLILFLKDQFLSWLYNLLEIIEKTIYVCDSLTLNWFLMSFYSLKFYCTEDYCLPQLYLIHVDFLLLLSWGDWPPAFLWRNIAHIRMFSTACGGICFVLGFFDQCSGYSWFFALACGYPHHLPPSGGFFVLKNFSWCRGVVLHGGFKSQKMLYYYFFSVIRAVVCFLYCRNILQ